MNRHTFKDVGKRSALSNELDDDDEEHEGDIKELKRAVEGEEDEGETKVFIIVPCEDYHCDYCCAY